MYLLLRTGCICCSGNVGAEAEANHTDEVKTSEDKPAAEQEAAKSLESKEKEQEKEKDKDKGKDKHLDHKRDKKDRKRSRSRSVDRRKKK